MSPKLTFRLGNRSVATLFQESIFGQGSDRWQKSAQTAGALDYKVSGKFTAGVAVSQDFNRLEKRRFIGTRGLVTSSLQTDKWLWSNGGGVLIEQRRLEPLSHNESGVIYESELRFKPSADLRWGQLRAEGEITALRTTPRKNILVGYDLPEFVHKSDTVALAGSQSFSQRKYFSSTTTFESVARQNSEQRRWDLTASKALPVGTRARFNAAYRYDRYDYEYEGATSDLLRQNDNLTSIFQYQLALTRDFGEHVVGEISYLFNRTDEDFGSTQTNQLAETGQLNGRGVINYGDTDSIEVSGQLGVTSYFAPSGSTFFSDRDRSIRVAGFRITHSLNKYFTAIFDASYRGFHLIYISGELSANNNINNVYIVNPTLIWQPVKSVKFQQNYQLHANYIYYEYEKDAVSLRNTLYRRANVSNNLSITVSPRLDLILEYSYRFEDFGRLIWEDQWKQQVSWDRRTHRPRVGVEYHPRTQFRFYPYASYEIQTYFDHLFDENNILGQRVKSDELSRSLIGFELQWEMSMNSYIDCRLERRVQDYQRQRRQDYNAFTITIRRTL